MPQFSFEVGAVDVTLVEGSARLIEKLLQIPDPKAQQSTSYRSGLCSGMKGYFNREKNTFPAGLLYRVEKRLIKRGHTVVKRVLVAPKQMEQCPPDYCIGIDMSDDRQYQCDSVNAVVAHFAGLLWLATNSGKSAIIAALCGKVVRELKQKVVVVVPTGLLLHQTSKDIKQFLGPDVSVGLAGGGQKFRNPHVLVGTYQTLVQGVPTASGRSQSPEIQRFLESAGMVLVDEAQHAGSPSIQSILRTCGKALYRVGLTGTVDKRDLRITQQEDIKARFHRYEMEQYLGPVLLRVTNQDLIEKGISAIPTLYTVEDREAFGPVVQTPRQIPPGCGKPINIYGEVFTKAVVEDKRFRKSVMHVVAALLEQGKPPLVMSHSVDHLIALKKTADKWGIPVELVTGRESLRERQKVIDRFVKEQNFAILGSSCLDEGVSINAIRAVVLAGTRKSPVEILQRIGRGLRKKKDGPNTVTVVDFDPMHSTMLHKHFLTRAATYRAEGFPRHVIEDISTVSQINFP